MSKPGNHQLRIGLTGGIASGKSTVANLFVELSIAVIDTDIVARQVVEPGQPGLKAVTDAFGANLLSGDGHLDRRRLRNLIFDNPDQRQILEGIVHPLIRARTIELANQAGGPYQILVVPLLIETGFRALVDRVLVVDCSEQQQRARLLTRDDETPERVERILAAQAHRHERLAAADDILDNSGSLEQTRTQVQELHTLYLQLAKQGSDP